MKTRVALLFVILSLLATSVHATDFKKGVGSGWFLNVHNWTQPWGTAAKPGKRFFEDTVADIRRLKKAKFDHMRLHFHIDGLLFWKECKGWKDASTYDKTVQCYKKNWAKQKKAKWKTKKKFFTDNKIYLNLFMDALKRITGEGMNVIIVPWGFHGEAGAAYKFTDGALHGDAAFRTLYVKFWSHLTRRIRKEITGWQQIAFQTYNEPFFCNDSKPQVSKWRSVEKRVIRAIRKQIPTSTIFTGAVCTNGDMLWGVDSAGQPLISIEKVMSPYKQFKNLIYTIHFRQPRVFVFQSFNYSDVKGLKYPMNRANVSSVLSKADDSKSDLKIYRDSKWKRTVLFDAIRQAADWKTKHGVRLHFTEWGTTRSNVDGKGGGPDRRGRLLYTRDMVDAMKKYGITWTHSEWRGWDGITKKYIYGNDDYNTKNRLLDPAMIQRLKR